MYWPQNIELPLTFTHYQSWLWVGKYVRVRMVYVQYKMYLTMLLSYNGTYSLYIPILMALSPNSFLHMASVVKLAIDILIHSPDWQSDCPFCPSADYQLLTVATACWVLSFLEVLLHFNKFPLFIFFVFNPWRFFCLCCFCHCIMLMLAANITTFMLFVTCQVCRVWFSVLMSSISSRRCVVMESGLFPT